MKKPQFALLPPAILAIILLFLNRFTNLIAGRETFVFVLCCIVTVAVFVFSFFSLTNHEREQLRQMDDIFGENAGAAGQAIRQVNIPCLLTDDIGNIVWRNDIMEKLYPEKELMSIMPDYPFAQPPSAYALEHAGGNYQVMSMQVRRKSTDRVLTFQYWLDRTEAAHYERLYEENRPYISLIYVDNIDELTADRQFHRSSVLTEVERLVADTASRLNGVYRRYETGRFMLIFESKALKTLEESRFSLLEAAHRIDTGTTDTVSLSVAVGVADSIAQSDESARQAMELALGRGGDQAVVKSGKNYSFYGGKHQPDSMQSRVKARLFAKALRQLFENSGDVFVMGHQNSDMDCIGSALGIVSSAMVLDSRAYIILDEPNDAIECALGLIKQNEKYRDCLITPAQAEKMMKPNSVLVVVDTQRKHITVAPNLIEATQKVVVIDHHRRSADSIDVATLHYLEPRASSAAELITEVIQYFDDNMRIPSFVASALLAGITLDTKHFAFNVGSRTFEAAGYLRKNGADISLVKQMFQEDMESFRYVSQGVCNAELVAERVAVAICGADGEPEWPNEKLIAAKVADKLISIRGVEAAFTLGRANGVVNISGRSLGNINAQIICERLGGGGHLTMAGAQLPGKTLEEACVELKTQIEQYLKEVQPE